MSATRPDDRPDAGSGAARRASAKTVRALQFTTATQWMIEIEALVLFMVATAVVGRSLLWEPRTAPFDTVVRAGGLLVGVYLCAIAAAAVVTRQPLRVRSARLDARLKMLAGGLIGVLALWAAIVALIAGSWLVVAGSGLVLGAAVHGVQALDRQVAALHARRAYLERELAAASLRPRG
jgi:hypothetical protein